jgi:hypothetical protein
MEHFVLPDFVLPDFVLTRYLYDKEKVKSSLSSSILKKKYNESCFWAYELYFSGFQKETLDQLWNIYKDRFSKNHPKLGIYIHKKYNECHEQPELIATILKNLTMKNPDVHETQGVKFVNVKAHHIQSFRTKENPIPDSPWKTLRLNCLYGVIGNGSKERLHQFRENWLFYAMKSPYWFSLIESYGGKVVHNKVVFDDEDKEEEFYNRYNYEPDEQPLDIQYKCIGG